MSDVTNVILYISGLDDPEAKIAEVNRYFEDPATGRPKGLVSIYDPVLPRGWYGGSKAFEAEIFLGAYNHFDLDRFLRYLRPLRWEYPEALQVIVKEQDSVGFRIIHPVQPDAPS